MADFLTRLSLVACAVAAALAAASPGLAAGLGSVTGRVIDADTRQPLERADVVVEGTGRGAYTNAEGRYEIRDLEPGTYKITFSFVSYETAVVTDAVVQPHVPTIVNRALTFSFFEVEAVEVNPSYFPEERRTTTSTVSLSREEIRRFPGGLQDVVRTVSTLPGVALLSQGGRNDLLVRGGGPSENLYLVNGIEVPNINHFGSQGASGGALSFINLDLIDDVKFSTGDFGAAYGDKMSSSLAIEIREGRSDRVGGKATVAADRFGFHLEGPVTKRGSFFFSARRSYLDFLFKALGAAFIPVYTDLNLHATFQPSPSYEVSILGLAALDDLDRDVSTEENRVQNTTILGNSQDRWIGGVRLRRLFDRGFVDLSAGFNQTDFELSQADTAGVQYFRSEALEREASLRSDAFWRLPNLFDATFGGSVKRVTVDNTTAFADTVYDRSGRRVPREELDLPGLTVIDARAVKAAAWGEGKRRFGRRFELTAGVRYDYFEFLDSPHHVAGRLAARYDLTRTFDLKGSIGTYYQAPSYVWLQNPLNAGLDALRNDMSVLGFDYLLRYDVNLSTEVWYKRYTDLPAGATDATSYLVLTNTGVGFGGREDDFQSFGYIPLESTGRGRSVGIDLLLQKRYSDTRYFGSLGLTIGKTEYDAPNGITYPGQFDQRLIASFTGGYVLNPKWEVSGKFRVASGAPFTPVYDPATNGGFTQSLPDEYLSARMTTTHSLDIRVDRRFAFENWSMITFLDIQNIYNYANPVPPQWDFWEQRVISNEELAFFPTIGISAEF